MRIKRFYFMISAVVVSGTLIAWLITKMDGEKSAILLRSVQLNYLLIATILICLAPLAMTLRFLGVLQAQSRISIPFYTVLRAVLLANVLNTLIPSKGGDLAKALYIRRECRFSVGIGAVVLERIVDLFFLGLFAIIGGFFRMSLPQIFIGLLTTVAVLLLLVLLLFVPVERAFMGWSDAILSFRSVFRTWLQMPMCIFRTVAGSFSSLMIGCGIFASLVLSFGYSSQVIYALSIYPVALLSGLMPISVSGIGVRDSVFVFFLEGAIPIEASTMIAFGYTVFSYWISALIALPWVIFDVFRFLRKKEG